MPDTLYLIDGHAQIFRAYYAIRGGLTSPVTGEPTQAVFGMATMFMKLLSTCRPQYIAMAVDSGGRNFRNDLYAQYKANRAAPPADLDAQIPRIFELTELFGIPIIRYDSAEADDIIATVTRRLLCDGRYPDLRIKVVSKDKDLEQLLCDRVTMYDIQTRSTIDSAALMEAKGIRPDQVVDLLTLTGDAIDNVPGVPGIGPKTAATLIQRFGSLDGILANLDQIKGKCRENLEKAKETLALSRSLVRLKDDLEFEFELEDARAGSINAEGLCRLFEELGFVRHVAELQSLLRELSPAAAACLEGAAESGGGVAVATGDEGGAAGETSGGGAAIEGEGFAPSLFEPAEPVSRTDDGLGLMARRPGVTVAQDFDYRGVTTPEQLDELVGELRQQKLFALDTETTGLHAGLCGMSFAWRAGHGVYVPTACEQGQHLDQDTVIAALKGVLEDAAIGKTGHNLKYDLLALRKAGVRVRGVVFDTLIASHLLGSPNHRLYDLALAKLKHQMIPITRLIGAAQKGRGKPLQKTMDQVPLDLITTYAAEDADISLRLYEHFAPQLRVMGLESICCATEFPLIEVLAEMEHAGFRVDPGELSRQQKQLGRRIAELRDQIQEKIGGEEFNPDSPKQLADVLFKRLKLPVIKRTKTGPSTDIEVLERLAELDGVEPEKLAVPRLIVEYRQLTKLVGTYLEALRESIDAKTGRVHATFHQAVTATGRLSSSNPNLQNIPIRTDVGRQVRKAFIADPGPPPHVLISADYSQIELRILAHLSRDPALIDAFERDLDIHTAVAAQVFNTLLEQVTREQRAQAKIINFGIVYGVTPYGLVRRIEGLDVEGAKQLIADYKQRFKGIDAFLQQCIRQAMNLGYVTTMGGRRRPIPEIMSGNGSTRALGERLAINTVVQGSAAELIKMAMVNLHRRIERDALPMRMLLQIHDELVFECPADAAEANAAVVREEMERAMELKVPLKVEVGVGKDWFEAK